VGYMGREVTRRLALGKAAMSGLQRVWKGIRAIVLEQRPD